MDRGGLYLLTNGIPNNLFFRLIRNLIEEAKRDHADTNLLF